MKYLLDTNICIYLIKQKPLSVIEKLQMLAINEVGISVITLAELEYGVAKSSFIEKNRIALAKFIAPIEVLPFSDKATVFYGDIHAYLEKKGIIIGAFDLLIAAQALAENLILVTNNEREFNRVPGLVIENWVG
jgi:tRNA(fMet)-specific endonuclease VapC